MEERGGEDVRGEDGSGGGATAVEVEGGGREGGLVLRRLPAVKSLSDKVLKAEVLWVLKTVESSVSIPSFKENTYHQIGRNCPTLQCILAEEGGAQFILKSYSTAGQPGPVN